MNDLNNSEKYRKEIQDWFSSEKNFDEGFVLFVRFSHNRALAMQLARKQIQSKLEYELQKIMERSLIIERPVMHIGVIQKAVAPVIEKQSEIESEADKIGRKIDAVGRTRVKREEQIDYDALTDQQRALFDDNRAKHKEMRTWHEKMKLAKTDQERATFREKVIELDNAIRENWKTFDALFLPEGSASKEPETVKKESDPFKAVNNARSYLSKNLPKLESLSGKKLDDLKAKIKERYQAIVAAGQVVDDETLNKLKSCGIIVE